MGRKCIYFAAAILCVCVLGLNAFAQTTEFTYQGRLIDNNVPPTATYDFEFVPFAEATDGIQLSSPITAVGVPVRNGIFSVVLDFGTVFNGGPVFLEIRVRPNGGGGFTTLSPRQPVTSAPYGIRSLNAVTADSAATATTATTATNALNLGGVPAGQFVVTADTRLFDSRDPNAGSGHYVQNQNGSAQPSTNFNISGTGTANIFNAGTQFNIGGNRVLSTPAGQNIFVGASSGFANTKGGNNAFIGDNAGRFNTTGSRNSFTGYAAGFNTTEGGDNSFFGNYAGFTNITGTGNSALGYNADVNTNNLSFATAIGSGSRVTASNQVQLGRNGADTVSIGKLADPANTQLCINGTVLASCTPEYFVTTDDPRLSDNRNPTEGSEFYIQNQNAAAQNGNFNISGNGVVGGTLAVGSSDNTFNVTAVTARSYGGQAVIGESRDAEGVVARSSDGTALLAESQFRSAIVAKSSSGGTAVDVHSPQGPGMVINSLLTGLNVESAYKGVVIKSQSAGVEVESTQGYGVVAKGLLGGVDAEGTVVGVRGKGTAGHGGHFTGAAGGVIASGPYGVIADGGIAGVVGTSDTNTGVVGDGVTFGVTGTSANVGVKGQGGEFGLVGSGIVGISASSTNPGGFAGRFTGNVEITGILINPSDVRLKKDIGTLDYGLKDVMRLHPVTWVWKNQLDSGSQFGLIAQEVETVMPELVKTINTPENDLEETKGLNYSGLIPVLIKAVQEQQGEIETLRTERSQLVERLASLERILEESEELQDVNEPPQDLINDQQAQIDALRDIVCSIQPEAAPCKAETDK